MACSRGPQGGFVPAAAAARTQPLYNRKSTLYQLSYQGATFHSLLLSLIFFFHYLVSRGGGRVSGISLAYQPLKTTIPLFQLVQRVAATYCFWHTHFPFTVHPLSWPHSTACLRAVRTAVMCVAFVCMWGNNRRTDGDRLVTTAAERNGASHLFICWCVNACLWLRVYMTPLDSPVQQWKSASIQLHLLNVGLVFPHAR